MGQNVLSPRRGKKMKKPYYFDFENQTIELEKEVKSNEKEEKQEDKIVRNDENVRCNVQKVSEVS